MKTKGMLGIAMLSALGFCFGANAFADDATISPEEAKRLKAENAKVQAENAKLKKALEKKNDEVEQTSTQVVNTTSVQEEGTTPRHFWGSITAKYWDKTMDLGDGVALKGPDQIFNITLGYNKFYFNSIMDLTNNVLLNDAKNPDANMGYVQNSLNLGYLISSEFSVALGVKNVAINLKDYHVNQYFTPNGVDDITVNPYKTIGAAYQHQLEDSAWSIQATVTLGRKTVTPDTPSLYTGTTSTDSTYLGYDIGVGSDISKSFRFNLYYRVEQFDTLMPNTVNLTGPIIADLSVKTFKASGPGLGISYSF